MNRKSISPLFPFFLCHDNTDIFTTFCFSFPSCKNERIININTETHERMMYCVHSTWIEWINIIIFDNEVFFVWDFFCRWKFFFRCVYRLFIFQTLLFVERNPKGIHLLMGELFKKSFFLNKNAFNQNKGRQEATCAL